MDFKNSLELVMSLGTPSFHNMVGSYLVNITNSSKLMIIRYFDGLYVVLDAQGLHPSHLEYDDMMNLIEEVQLPNVFEFPFDTFILCDGEFIDSEVVSLLNGAFEKEMELFEKNRLITVIDRLSYQLSAFESLVLNISDPLEETKFVDIIQSSISELLFCSVTTFKVEGLEAKKISNIGFIESDIENIELDEDWINLIEMGIPLLTDESRKFREYKKNRIKVIMPIGTPDNTCFIMLIVRDTKIEEEEKLFLNTISRIIQHFYYKQFIELIDFRLQLSEKTLNILSVFDNVIKMLKTRKSIDEILYNAISNLSQVKSIHESECNRNLEQGVYLRTDLDCQCDDCDIVVVYKKREDENTKYLKVILNNKKIEVALEMKRLLELILEGYTEVYKIIDEKLI